MQRNISVEYVDILVAKHTDVSWKLLPANEIERILREEEVIIDRHLFAIHDTLNSCLVFVPKGIGYLAGVVDPATIIHAPTELREAAIAAREAKLIKELEASQHDAKAILSASEDSKDNEGEVKKE